MDRTENLDLLIHKMADPALMQNICSLYKKKRSFKSKNKTTIHPPFFNETEECLKLLGFSVKESVTNDNFKEFDSDEDLQNCNNVIQSDCNTKQGQTTDFSEKQRKKMKLMTNSVVRLSSDSSGDEIELTQMCTINECKANGSRVVSEKKSRVKNKLLENSNESAAFLKSQSKIMPLKTHHSPKSKLSNQKTKGYSIISDTEEAYSNNKRNKKKSTKRNKLSTTYASENNSPSPHIIKPYPGAAAFAEQDIITISSDSSIDSDEDVFEQVNYESTAKKCKVRESGSKNLKTHAKFASIRKSANISEANTGNEISLLDHHNLSKSDLYTTVKEHAFSKIPSAKNRFISKQNSGVKIMKKLKKTDLRNKAQDISERKINFKRSENKASAKSGGKSNNSFMSHHSDNLSSALHNSNIMSSKWSDSSSDEVLFQGVYKSVNPNASHEEHKTSKNKSIKLSNDLENPEKAHAFYDATCNAESLTSNSLFSVDNCIGNNEGLEEIYVENNVGKEVDSIPSKQSRADGSVRKKMDFVPEPVDFEIPPLHEKGSVATPSKEDLARWAKQGVKRKKGRWTPKENEILKRNFSEFSNAYGISNPCTLLGIYSDKKVDAPFCRFLKAKHFYLRLGKDLNDRTLKCIYKRARHIFHPYASNKKWSSEDISKLINLYNIFGNNWNKIGQILKKTAHRCESYFRVAIAKKKMYSSKLQNKKHHK